MIEYDYLRPDNLEEVFGLLKEYGPKATLIAGGTDVMVKIRNTKKAPEVLVSIRGLKDLRYIEKKKGLSYRGPDNTQNTGTVGTNQDRTVCPA